MITSLATVWHYLSDQHKLVLCNFLSCFFQLFLSYRYTMSYTDHLSTFSNQSQGDDVEFSVEFSGTTFVEHVQATEVGVSR
ncbi:unnamed protein product [Schistosoma mattheei]|uniref:Uncharacterized protein n=1 Tax=Schistosoma mattheei TaxID=31246 RepID=A0A3P7ZI73_9TREM|nr:unnamed protein product [Schistosoma mattheei]